ncbi:peptidoglycan DD-metalloendopeptidase family protein [Mammaliicoccus sciuri]|uniref:peptidoglycan DD-metalloendopeptidase family protein n=1 Tax=Mammaliicoccus sciuri TaxID=1296 RepID=UPI001E40504E|nr:peptidoglycan DD-metalloendopeptidase family protein [Mammaliicoccus sciuri]MCD8798694.1 peptidoglycan DD-metalloendopeptidase family protein [Mammaliicoccus sciuri]
MAEEVRSMSISLSMKDLGVDRTISEIRRSFRSLRDDVKLVNKDFQYGEKSIDSYTNKIDELTSASKIAEKNVEELSKKYHEVGKEQGYTSKEALALRQEWAKQKNELNFLQRDLEGATNDLKAFQKQQMISNSNWTKTGNAFTGMSKSLESISGKLQSTGKSLTNSITKPAMVAGGALAGITLSKGWSRLIEIDNAKAKLDGLGHSSQNVQKIMDNALESVKGTSFGLGEAATTASSAVAAGIKPGKELTRYLSLTGDAASIAGTSMGEMGSIINKVQTSNKAYNGELQQLSERGIPIYQWIAKEAGVTADEVFKMASEGEISSKMFLDSIESNIGGAAKKMGEKSFTAGMSNMWAAVGRLGASFLDAGGKGGGFFSKMKPLMANLTEGIDGLGGSAEAMGEKFGDVFSKIVDGITGIVNWYNSLDKGTQKLIASIMKWSTLILIGIGPALIMFGKVAGVLATIFGPFGKLLGFMGKLSAESKIAGGLFKGFTNLMPKTGAVITALTGPIGWITLGIVALGTAFVIAYKKSETFRNIVNSALNGVKQTFINIGNVVKGFFQLFKGNGQDGVITLSKILPPNVVVGLTNFATKVKTIFFQVINAIKTFATSIGSQLNAFWSKNGTEIMTAVKNIGSAISTTFKFIWNNIIKPIMTLIWNLMKVLWPAIRMLIVSVWNNIKGVIQGSLNIILGVIKVFSSLLTGNWKGVWQGIVQILRGAVKLAWNLVQLWFVGKILKVVKVGLAALKGVVTKNWRFIHTFIATIVYAIWNKVKAAFNGLYKSTRSIFTNLSKFSRNLWTSLRNAITKFAQSIWTNVRTKFSGLFKSTRSIFTNLSKWTRNLWTALKNRITSLGQMIWTNIRNKFNGLYKSTRSIFTSLSKWSRNLWTNLKNAITKLAQNIWTNVRNKFAGMFNSVRNTLKKLFNSSKNIFTNIKNSVTNLTHGARDNVVNGFKAMYNKGKSWIGKLKNFLSGSISGFKKVAGNLGKGVANGAIKGMNAMIDGINSLSNKIMKKKLIKNKIPKLSTGTGVQTDKNGLLKRGTKAIVNDRGLGNGTGPNGHKELIYRRSGKVERPIGNNKKVTLRRGDGVLNGAQSKSLLPHFAKGTGVPDWLVEQGGKVKGTAEKGLHKATDGAKGLIEDGKDLAGSAKKAFDKAIGDVMDYVKNPMKLVDKTMSLFGVDFSNIKGAMGGMMQFGYKGLKKSVKDLVEGWFAEAEGGDGDSSWLLKHNILQTFGYYKGMTMNGTNRHWGVDFGMPTGTKIKALTDGTVTQAGWVNGGGGNQVTLKEPGGKWFQWYMHMMNGGVKVKKGQKVKAGDLLGLSGNTGSSNTPHLHIQRMKGYPSNDTAVDPMSWLKSLKGGGTNKVASKWVPEIKKAAKRMNVNLTSGELKGIIAQIQRESNGNAGVTQGNIGDINNLLGTPAQGLLQYVPSTFKAYAVKGHGNIKSGYDQLLAFFNNKNWRKDLPYGKSGWGPSGGRRFATGGIIKSNGLYNLAEEGHEEVVIPTDPRRSSDAMKLINYAANKVQRGKNGNKRPNQIKSTTSNVASNHDAEILQMLAKQIEQQQEQINILTKIALSNQDIANKPVPTEEGFSRQQGKRSKLTAYNLGGAY